MQPGWSAKILVLVLAGGSAGCSMFGTGGGETLDAGSLAATPGPSAALAPPAVPEHVAMGSFLEGPVGSKLGEADRQAAFKAESQAVSAGERRTWRGTKGVYGFVVPASSASPAPSGDGTSSAGSDSGAGECRTFTHTIYFGGRPQTGRGTGCREADGTWRIVS